MPVVAGGRRRPPSAVAVAAARRGRRRARPRTGASPAGPRSRSSRRATRSARRPGRRPTSGPARTAAPADRYAFLVGVQDYRRPTQGHHRQPQGRRRSSGSRCSTPAGCRQNIRVVVDEQATGAAVRDGHALARRQERARHLRAVPLLRARQAVRRRHRGAVAGRPRLRPRHRGDARLLGRGAAACGSTSPAARRAASCPGCRATACWSAPAARAARSPTSTPTGACRCGPACCSTSAPRQGQADADADGRTTIGEALRYCHLLRAAHHAAAATARPADAPDRGRPGARLDAGRPAGLSAPRTASCRACPPSARRSRSSRRSRRRPPTVIRRACDDRVRTPPRAPPPPPPAPARRRRA